MFSKLSVQVYITALASKQNLIETRNSNIQILETKAIVKQRDCMVLWVIVYRH